MTYERNKKGMQIFMKNFQFISKSETDTKNFAKALASKLKNKDIIVLTR